MKRRIYTDTSVIGGCRDEEFRDGSVALFDAFRAGAAIMVVSDVTREELETAPQAVRDILDSVSPEYREDVLSSDDDTDLARAYIREGVLSPKDFADAQHVEIATVNRVDALVSWDFKHIVNSDRIDRYNALNLAFGHATLEIHTPDEALRHED